MGNPLKLFAIPVLACLLFLGQSAFAGAASGENTSKVDAVALKAYESAYRKAGTVTVHLNLTQVFGTQVPWAFVAVQGPTTHDPTDETDNPGEIAFCLVRVLAVDCNGPSFEPLDWARKGPWAKNIEEFRNVKARIVPVGDSTGRPLLLITALSLPSGDGDMLVSTFVLGYDGKADRFEGLFANGVGTNNNERTRFIEKGPLAGAIAVDMPTGDAPFGYWISIYKQSAAGPFAQVLRYRSLTRYGDGNPLSVIDSEMPEILRRLGLWKAGDPLPRPQEMPQGCHALVMRKGVEICR